MRRAIGGRGGRGGSIEMTRSFPAPIGGWNQRDPISGMGKADAVAIENWAPVVGTPIRPGFQLQSTGLGGPTESLMEWAPTSGNNKLFAATPTTIWDVSATGVAPTSVQSSLTSARWQHVNFANPAGTNYLYCVNGADAPRYYDGSAWQQPTLTGPSNAANLINVNVHMNRLWFVEKNTRKAWYLAVGAITGALQPFDMASLVTQGGTLVAMATWTMDGGNGPDDYGAFIFSSGEVLLYAGTNPAADTSWALHGRYKLAEPIGRRCVIKVGAELLVLTARGPVPLSTAISLSEAGQRNEAVTDKITGAFVEAYRTAAASFGWQMIEHPKRAVMIVNVPRMERVKQDQFVFGTQVRMWCPWTGLNGGVFGLFNGDLYFGDNSGTVWKVDGTTDNGQPIVATYQSAFTDFGMAGIKRCLRARAKLTAPPGYVPAVSVKVDFDTSLADLRTVAAVDNGPAWDVTSWDTAYWGFESAATQAWQGVEGTGTQISVAMRIATTAKVALNGIDVTFEAGGTL